MSTVPTLPVVAPPAIAPAPAPMTEEEFYRRHAGDRVEFVNGVVRELPMPFFEHGNVCGTFTGLVFIYLQEHDLGRIASNDTFVTVSREPLVVRGADVCYYSYERLPKGPVPRGHLPVAPDLVAEMRSPSDVWTEVLTKVVEYLKAGVRVVLVFDVVTKTVSAIRDTEAMHTFRADEDLTVPDVLPGF